MTTPRQATDLAAATAKVAHGGVTSGDNQPAATAALEARFSINGVIHDREPRRVTRHGRAMCAGWGGGEGGGTS